MTNHKNWFDKYSRWKNDCVFELLNMGYDVAYNGNDTIISEDGSVHFDNITVSEPVFVTPWKSSRFYIK